MLFPKHNLNYSAINTYLSEAEITEFFNFKIKEVQDSSLVLKNIFYCCSFQNPVISDLLHRAKFGGQLAICNDLVKILKLAYSKGFIDKPDFLTFVPADPKRFKQRHYHIPQILALKLANILEIEVVDLFKKTISTKAQSELSKSDRLINLEGVFKINSAKLLPNWANVCIVDDVTTTGTTLNKVATTLHDFKPNLKISAIALAG